MLNLKQYIGMNYYTEVLKKYMVFAGRARRKEYWMFALWNTIISIALAILGNVIAASVNNGDIIFIVLIYGYALAILLPSIAVFVRRLHDTGRSGAWIFINLIPFIGAIISLIFSVMDSQPGDNQYGPNPKGITGPQTTAAPLTTNTPTTN